MVETQTRKKRIKQHSSHTIPNIYKHNSLYTTVSVGSINPVRISACSGGITLAIMTITWHTHIDERTCPFCAPLDNHTWSFDTKTQHFPELLHNPAGQVAWDLDMDEPRTHGVGSRRGPWNCRCWLTYSFDDQDIVDTIRGIISALELEEKQL